MTLKERQATAVSVAGMVSVLVGAVLYEAGVGEGWWAVLVGGLLLFFGRLHAHMQGDKAQQSQKGNGRVSSILMFSAGMICVGAYLMMKGKGYWLLPLMIAAATELYAGLRMK